MTPTKLLIGQILIVFAIVVAGLWAATQWAAAMLAYQPQLGAPWFLLGDAPIYRPWSLFAWWYHYEAYAPEVFDRAGALAGASGFAGCAAAVAGSIWRARQSSHVTTYGSARWAAPEEIAKSGLFEDAGVFLGRFAGTSRWTAVLTVLVRPPTSADTLRANPQREFGCRFCEDLAHEDVRQIGLVTLVPVERLVQRLDRHRALQHLDARELVEHVRDPSLQRRHQHRLG